MYPDLGALIPDGAKIVQPKKKDAIDTSLECSINALPDDLRRTLYDTLLPLDRGDFRYEFLVPWVEEGSLSTADKFIITTSFISLSFALQLVLEQAHGASVGVHASLIVQFFSYAVGNPIFFRLLAILASMLDIMGNLLEAKEHGLFTVDLLSGASLMQPQGWLDPMTWGAEDVSPVAYDFIGWLDPRTWGTEDVFPVAYDFLFLIINGYYVILWCLGNDAFAAPNFTADQEEVFTKSFGPLGIRRAQFARLLKSLTFEVGAAGEDGTTLCAEGEDLTALFVPLAPVEVRVRGVVTATLAPHRLVGEAALLACLTSDDGRAALPSRATIAAPPGARFARVPHRAFWELQREEGSDFAASVQVMIARTLSDKLRAARLESREATVELDAWKDRAFADLDQDNDGVLDRGEFRSFLAPLDGGSTTAEFVSEIALLRSELKTVRRELRDCKDGKCEPGA